MLRHLAYGWRNFTRDPDLFLRRANWEFFAIIKGRCAPHFFGTPLPRFRASTLWLLPPQTEYTWKSPDRACLRVMFQIGSLPQIMTKHLGQRRCYEIRITEAEGRQILQHAEKCQRIYYHPDETYELRLMHLVSELCLKVLEHETFSEEDPLHLVPLRRVQKAEVFYREQIRSRPTLFAVASAVGVSESQLRRDFHKIRKAPPEKVFRSLRLDEACRLLLNTTLTNEQIASETAFGSAVDFHRSFKNRFGVTPLTWRNRTSIKEPVFGLIAPQPPRPTDSH